MSLQTERVSVPILLTSFTDSPPPSGQAMRYPSSLFARRPWKAGAGLAAYMLLALVVTSPLVWSPRSAIPTLPGRSEAVPLLNLWTIWWNVDRLGHAFQGYWQAPIFYPAPDAFAFSEPQPLTALLAPVLWGTGSRILTYNLFLWLSLVLNGVAAERLLRRVGAGRLAAFLGGGMLLALPFVLWQLDVVQLVPLWGILWSWSALVRMPAGTPLRRGLELGLACGVTGLLSLNVGLFHCVLLAATGWILVVGQPWKRVLAVGGIATAVVLVLVGPFAVGLRTAAARHGFQRDAETMRDLSAIAGDYAGVPDRAWIKLGRGVSREGWELSPGWLKVGGALMGAAWGVRRRRLRRWTLFLVSLGAAAFLLSLGPNLRLGGWEPWSAMARFVPGMSQVRSVFRFACFAQIAVVLLAAQSLQGGAWIARRLVPSSRNAWAGWSARVATLLIGAAFVFEIPPIAARLVTLPPAQAHETWIEFLRLRTPEGAGIACLPIPSGNRVSDFDETARWMYFGTFHHIPLLNGYSGFFPPEDFERREILHREFPGELGMQLLAGLGIEFVVVRRTSFPDGLAGRWGGLQLSLALRDDAAGIDIYEIRRQPEKGE